MLFHKIETTSRLKISAGNSKEKELKVNYLAGFSWLVGLIILFILAIYTYQIGWIEGSSKILSVAITYGGFGGGIFFGERVTATEAYVNIH